MTSYRNPRPKRPAAPTPGSAQHIDAALRSSGLAGHDAKKPKFDTRNPHALVADDDDDDAGDLFLEIDDGAIGKTRGRDKRRNEVELEGYESDSSEEGFDATRKTWEKDGKGKGKAVDDDDDNMFGGGEDEEDEKAKEEGQAAMDKKKGVKFMKLDEIEGQEFDSHREFVDIIDEDRGRGDASSGSDEDEMDEDADLDPEVGAGGSKKHAPKLDAFNMKSEMDEGRFDSTGTFIRKATEKDAVHDSWLQGVSRKDMKRARDAMETREREARERMIADDQVITADVLSRLIANMEVGESILESLARLGGGRKKKVAAASKNKNQWRQKKKAAAAGEAVPAMEAEKAPEDPAETKRKEAVEAITGAADMLLTRGQLEIYDETRESLMRQFHRETGEDWKPPAEEAPAMEVMADRKWEYRWTDGRDGEAVYGPYGNSEMKAWSDAGFFGDEVEFREKGGVEGWTRAPTFG
ncbi:hypothetical protein EDC01DRAFT_661074 [Geopyxis carbonaria]|nr:hypothetical protein EDC01DRAFT_661074 [Geopyxis carbonaria]